MRWSTKAEPSFPSDGSAPGADHRLARSAATAALALVSILFPFAVLFAADSIGIWPLLALLALAAVLRMTVGASGKGVGAMVGAQACAVGLIIAVGLFDEALAARLYPVAVSGALLIVFAGSLLAGAPVIEQLARLTEPDLPPEGVAYCRAVTKMWCGFFILNGGVALSTALWADRTVWAIYNGFVSYCLMGALFAAEYAFRRRMRRRVAAS